MKTTDARPEYVKVPVTTTAAGWQLGLVKPDQEGYTPDVAVVSTHDFNKALAACMMEAGRRGISGAAFEATVLSSMGVKTFDEAMAQRLRDQLKGVTK